MMDVILDLDTGIDDALAITYALGSADARLIGIVSTFGNIDEVSAAQNSLAVLDMFGASDVPVFRGLPHAQADSAFTRRKIVELVHGVDGVGDAHLARSSREPEADGIEFVAREAAARAASGEPLVYVPAGPLTNVAELVRRYPEVVGTLRVVLMGGAYAVPGNTTPYSEANIHEDPEAAAEVFASGLDVTMVGLDVTLQTLLTRHETARWRELGTPAGRFLADMTDFYIAFADSHVPEQGGCGLHDPLAVAVALDPGLVETEDVELTVELEGEERGRTRRIGPGESVAGPVHVARTVQVERFIERFMDRTLAMASAGRDGEAQEYAAGE